MFMDLRFMCVFRFKIWWMTQRMGARGQEIPFETQFLIVEGRDDSHFGEEEGEQPASYVVFLPILEGYFRAVLQGNEKNELEICLESAGSDPFDVITNVTAHGVKQGLESSSKEEFHPSLS
ncbi:hypothetical protein ACS0TY_034816 [Phlomoides rotata]